MLIRRSLSARKAALKSEILLLARNREPEMDMEEFENYLTDGLNDAFHPIERIEGEWQDRQADQHLLWQNLERSSS